MTDVPRPFGKSAWGPEQTARGILIRTVKTYLYEGAYSVLIWSKTCAAPVGCGSSCAMPPGHLGDCECGGDDPGSPGSCPA